MVVVVRQGGALEGDTPNGWQSSVDVVPDYSMFEGDDAFDRFMGQLAPPDDSGSDETATTTSSSSPPPSSSSTSAPSPDRKEFPATSADSAPKPSRKRRKHELDHLRGVAAALEVKLKGLSDTSNVNKPGGKYFWKRVSSQLMLEKQKALGENARLREILRDQVKVVKSLQRSLAKSPDLRVSVCCASAPCECCMSATDYARYLSCRNWESFQSLKSAGAARARRPKSGSRGCSATSRYRTIRWRRCSNRRACHLPPLLGTGRSTWRCEATETCRGCVCRSWRAERCRMTSSTLATKRGSSCRKARTWGLTASLKWWVL